MSGPYRARLAAVLAMAGAVLPACQGGTDGASPGGDTPVAEENAPAQPGTLRNGSFERPRVDSYRFIRDDVGGWAVVQGSVEVINRAYSADYPMAAGDQTLDLNGDDAGAVQQDVPTSEGARYHLVVKLASNPHARQPTTVRVEAGGETRSYTLPPGQTSYREESVPFTARAASTSVRLVSATGGTPYGPLVDDLSLAKE